VCNFCPAPVGACKEPATSGWRKNTSLEVILKIQIPASSGEVHLA